MPTATNIQEFTESDFHALAQIEQPLSLTLIVPNAGGPQASLGHTAPALNNLLRDAEEQLRHKGLQSEEISIFLKPIRSFFSTPNLWGGTEPSLLVFRTQDAFHLFTAALSLAQQVVLGNRFYLKPLLPYLTQRRQYYILSLSDNAVRLYLCQNNKQEEIGSKDLPRSLNDLLGLKDFSISLQAHSSGTGAVHGLTYHAHSGPVKEVHKNRLLYCERINAAVHKLLGASEDPLVLACVKEFVPLFQQSATYANLLSEVIPGNPDRLTPVELHNAAQEIIDRHERKRAEDNLTKYMELRDTKRSASELPDILQAAFDGRVMEALIANDVDIWGKLDLSTGTLSLSVNEQGQGNEEILNLIAIQTVLHRGNVTSLPVASMPAGHPAAAILRY